jgi:hypothetical protein
MKTIRVEKTKLLDAMRKNRMNHALEYAEAIVEYRKKSQKAFRKAVRDRAREPNENLGNSVGIPSTEFPIPVNRTRDYDTVISMLDFSVEEFVELDEKQFKCYVLDEWDWRALAAFANTAYGKGV